MSRNHADPLLLAMVLLSACAGTSNPSTPTTPAIPQIAGTYSGPTTDTTIQPNLQVPTWELRWLRPGDTSFRFRTCAGTLTIQQNGSVLTGSFRQEDTCGGLTGQMSGTVAADGTVTFLLTASSDPLAWTGFAQCTPLVTGTTTFTGTVRATMIDATLPHDALISCPAQGTLTVNVRIRGLR